MSDIQTQVAILEGAKTQLMEHGWVKDHFSTPEGQMCMTTALRRATEKVLNTNGAPSDRVAVALQGDYMAVRKTLINKVLFGFEIINFNDRGSTTFTDVIEALDQAIIITKESAHG